MIHTLVQIVCVNMIHTLVTLESVYHVFTHDLDQRFTVIMQIAQLLSDPTLYSQSVSSEYVRLEEQLALLLHKLFEALTLSRSFLKRC